jgi:hypothetical protein
MLTTNIINNKNENIVSSRRTERAGFQKKKTYQSQYRCSLLLLMMAVVAVIYSRNIIICARQVK